MKFSQLPFLLLFSLAACSSSNKSGLVLKGQIKNVDAGTKIYLEEVTYSARNEIDTAKLDAQGDFSFSSTLKNMGLYQLRIGDNRAIFLVLNEQPATVTIDADTASIKNFSYKVKGSPSSEQLRDFITQTKKYGEAFGMAMGEYNKNVNDSTPDSLRHLYETKVMMADSNFRTYARGYIDTVKNPIIAVFAVTNLDLKHDLATFQNLEARVKKDYPNLPFTQAFIAMMDKQQQQQSQEDLYASRFKEGDTAPDIALQNPLGSTVKLSSLRGQVVLLDFWASWCGPCRHENPNVVAAYEKYKSKGFNIFSVSLDTDHDKWVNAIKQDHLEWINHVSELKGWQSAICQQYGIQAIPQNFLLDKDGKIIGTNLRGEDLDQRLAQVLQ